MELGVDQATVSRALKRTRRQVRQALEERAEQEALVQLAQLEHVQDEAMSEWERSKRVSRETTTLSDARLLQRAMDAMEARRRILGVNAPERSELTGADGRPIQVEEIGPTDEERVRRMLALLERVKQRATQPES